MFPGWLHVFFRMIISNERSKGIRWSPTIWWFQQLLFDDPQVFDNPQLFDDPQLLDDQLEVWTLIIEKSTVIPPSLMVLFFLTRPQWRIKEGICTSMASSHQNEQRERVNSAELQVTHRLLLVDLIWSGRVWSDLVRFGLVWGVARTI